MSVAASYYSSETGNLHLRLEGMDFTWQRHRFLFTTTL